MPVFAQTRCSIGQARNRRRGVVLRAAVQAVASTETTRLPRWEYIFDVLAEKGVKTVKPAEAQQLLKKGYVSGVGHCYLVCIDAE